MKLILSLYIRQLEKIDANEFFGKKISKPNRNVDIELIYANRAISDLKSDTRVLLLMPIHTLYSRTKAFSDFRKKIIDDCLLRTVALFPQGVFSPLSSMSYCLLELSTSQRNNEVVLLNGPEITPYVTPRQDKLFKSFFNQLDDFWFEQLAFYPYVVSVNNQEIKNNNYSLGFSYYFNVDKNPVANTRNRDEELVSLKRVFREIKNSLTIIQEVPYIGMSQLADDITEYKIIDSSLPMYRGKEKLRPLNQSAIIIGTIVGSIKPTYFNYSGRTVYTKANVKVFEIPEEFDLDYLLLELRSDFVTKQFRNIQSGTTIPSIRISELENIFLRLPPLETQKDIVRNKFAEFAEEKLSEIRTLSDELEYIEKDVFSSFAHDFGKILFNSRGSVEIIENYIRGLADRDIISLKDSIYFEDEANEGDTIGDALDRMVKNQDRVQESLQSAVEHFTKSSEDRLEVLDLGEIIYEWIERQVFSNFEIKYGGDPGAPVLDENGKQVYHEGIEVYNNSPIEGYRDDIYHILNNFLDNAKEHGFIDQRKVYEFALYDYESVEKDQKFVILHVGNNGIPFPVDFTCEDFFQIEP